MIQFIGQRPGAKPLKQIMFYGMIKDFVALSNSISSFGIPSHALSMPNSIVKYCEVDFSKYANAIGAFYKIDPIKEHVNLLQSSVVKTKQGSDTFPLKILASIGASAGVVLVAWLVIGAINGGLERQTRNINEQIKAGQFDEKRAEMELMQGVKNNFTDYKNMVRVSKVLFDFLPRGTLAQTQQQLDAAAEQAEDNGDGRISSFGDVVVTGYTVTVTVYARDTDFPADFVEALHELDFFENITYTGFKPHDGGAAHARYEFDLTMQLKGGHIFMEDGSKFSDD
jgi:hypothetical protein